MSNTAFSLCVILVAVFAICILASALPLPVVFPFFGVIGVVTCIALVFALLIWFISTLNGIRDLLAEILSRQLHRPVEPALPSAPRSVPTASRPRVLEIYPPASASMK